MDKAITLYPNPAKSELTVAFPFEKGMILMLTDMMGRAIYLEKIEDVAPLLELDISTYESGVYFLSIKSEYGNWLEVTNFVKQ